MTNKLIKLERNFMFTDIFNQERNVSKLENFVSVYYDIPYDKVHNNLKLVSRRLEKSTKKEAWKEVDLVLKIANSFLKINLEINDKNDQKRINRNLIYLCKISSSNYEEGDNTYSNIWRSSQINFNINGSKNKKLINEYVFKEKETNEVLSELIQVDVINMAAIEDICYNELNEKEKIVYNFCKMLKAETKEEFEEASELIMGKEESKDLLNQVEQKSSEEDYLYMASAFQTEEEWRQANLEAELEEVLEEAVEEAKKEVRKETIEEQKKETAINFHKNGVSDELIINSLKITKEQLDEYLKEA